MIKTCWEWAIASHGNLLVPVVDVGIPGCNCIQTCSVLTALHFSHHMLANQVLLKLFVNGGPLLCMACTCQLLQLLKSISENFEYGLQVLHYH